MKNEHKKMLKTTKIHDFSSHYGDSTKYRYSRDHRLMEVKTSLMVTDVWPSETPRPWNGIRLESQVTSAAFLK
jgi:hypothetical protein